MAIKRRAGAVLALLMTSALVAAGCSSGGDGDKRTHGSELYKNPVTLTWWHNASQDGPGKTYWEKVAKDFSTACTRPSRSRSRRSRPTNSSAPGSPPRC